MNLEPLDELRLKNLVKEAVRDVFEEEMMKLRLLLAPEISEEEQLEINEAYGQPSTEIGRKLSLQED